MSEFRLSSTPLSRDVRFVCTDRGQHASRELAIIARDTETGALSDVGTGQTIGQRTVRRPGAMHREAGRARWELPACPSCKRAPRLTSERMALLVAAILDSEPTAQRVTWDASALN